MKTIMLAALAAVLVAAVPGSAQEAGDPVRITCGTFSGLAGTLEGVNGRSWRIRPEGQRRAFWFPDRCAEPVVADIPPRKWIVPGQWARWRDTRDQAGPLRCGLIEGPFPRSGYWLVRTRPTGLPLSMPESWIIQTQSAPHASCRRLAAALGGQ